VAGDRTHIFRSCAARQACLACKRAAERRFASMRWMASPRWTRPSMYLSTLCRRSCRRCIAEAITLPPAQSKSPDADRSLAAAKSDTAQHVPFMQCAIWARHSARNAEVADTCSPHAHGAPQLQTRHTGQRPYQGDSSARWQRLPGQEHWTAVSRCARLPAAARPAHTFPSLFHSALAKSGGWVLTISRHAICT
jgi:hypothetical protein